MTLSSDIVSDASSVFLDTDDFAESITLFPKGEVSCKETVSAIVSRDHEEGTREAHGDGVVNDENRAGKAIRTSLVIEVPVGTSVTEPKDEDLKPDLWEIDDEKWASKRILGRDDGLIALLVVRRDRVVTRFNPRSG